MGCFANDCTNVGWIGVGSWVKNKIVIIVLKNAKIEDKNPNLRKKTARKITLESMFSYVSIYVIPSLSFCSGLVGLG